MKKIFICMLMAAALCCFASAADVIVHQEKGYSVSYNAGTANTGNQYAMFILEGHDAESVDADKIIYIDQTACDSDGYVKFTDFKPKKVCDATVLITGGHLDYPKVYGIISPAKGKALYHGKSTAEIRLYNGETIIETAVTDADGSYAFARALAGNEYKISVSKNGYLSYTAVRTVDGSMTIPDIDVKTAAGDLNGSGRILINDLELMLSQFGKSNDGITLPFADFNSDGTVDISDLNILISNFNRTDIEE